MKKDKINLRQLVDKYESNCDRIREIANLMAEEKRERTDNETKEYEELVRSNQFIEMQIKASASEHLRQNPDAAEEAGNLIRENAANNKRSEIILVRDVMMVGDVANQGLIPLNIQDFIKPLVEGFILDKVGLPMPTGLSGDFVWPMYEMVIATVLGEGAKLADTKIPFSKMTANPARTGIAIPVTRQTLNQTKGLVEKVIRELMPLSVRMLLNNIICSINPVNEMARTTGLVGPFVEAVKTAVQLSPVPTFNELNAQMKAKVLESGIDGEHLCWVMSKSMEAILEGTPVNKEGIFVPMVQNHVCCGLPVYTTNAIRDVKVTYKKYSGSEWQPHVFDSSHDVVKYHVSGKDEKTALATILKPTSQDIAEVKVVTEYIGLGDWRYQPMGLFGSIRFIVDPYSKAREDSVDFILNCDYGTKTLRPEAFLIGAVKKA